MRDLDLIMRYGCAVWDIPGIKIMCIHLQLVFGNKFRAILFASLFKYISLLAVF